MMLNKLKQAGFVALGIGFWITVWIIASAGSDSFVFPSPKETYDSLVVLLGSKVFYKTVFASIGRILAGLFIGIFSGMLLGFVCHYLGLLKYIVSPLISVIRATPVASIIIILWYFKSNVYLPIIISTMMVTPLIWQSTIDAIETRDLLLYEVADVFELGFKKRFRLLIMPQIMKFLAPSIISSIGLAWKSGIAAEIITIPKNSIGKEIANSKNFFLFSEMFAWTICVVILSILLEYAVKVLIKKVSKNNVKG